VWWDLTTFSWRRCFASANLYFLRGFNLDHGTDFAATQNGVPLIRHSLNRL